jgi:cyclase
MAKKRVIFSLLYSSGYFFLSRNFRLQKAGDVNWLLKNFKFSDLSRSIDELVIVDVTRGEKDRKKYLDAVSSVISQCFIPVALGGSLESFEDAALMINSGADKLIFNSAYWTAPDTVRRVVDTYGEQCVIGCLDIKKGANGEYVAVTSNGSETVGSFSEWLATMQSIGFGELMIQSIDLDGTGFGLDLDILDNLPVKFDKPLILCGGSGKASHIHAGLQHSSVDAVATANLFNFIGDGLAKARSALVEGGLELAHWNAKDVKQLYRSFAIDESKT